MSLNKFFFWVLFSCGYGHSHNWVIPPPIRITSPYFDVLEIQRKTVIANKFVVRVSLSLSLKRELSSFFFHLWLCVCCVSASFCILSFARMGFCVFWSE
jgi:hypothetical protein